MSYDSRQQPRNQSGGYRPRRKTRFSGLKLRLMIGGAIVLFSVVSYLTKGNRNRLTGELQYVDMTEDEEIVLGLQAVGSMGAPSLNATANRKVDEIGMRLVAELRAKYQKEGIQIPYLFEFHLLADRNSVNAFALPGGQVFVTEGLFRQLKYDGQLAGVLGHEVGHVLERHGAERMANTGMWSGIASGAGMVGGDVNSRRLAGAVTQLITKKYSREDEYEADGWGVELMVAAGYNPEHMITVMDVLENSGGGGGSPEIMNTHPSPKNRRAYIKDIIAEKYPNGVPSNLY